MTTAKNGVFIGLWLENCYLGGGRGFDFWYFPHHHFRTLMTIQYSIEFQFLRSTSNL